MDNESFGAILRLMSEDLDAIAAESKGKAKEGIISDAEIARRLFVDEVTKNSAIIADHIMAKSIAQAVQSDSVTIAEATVSEKRAANDHAHACRLAGVANSSTISASAVDQASVDVSDELLKLMSAFNLVGTSSHEEIIECQAGPSTRVSKSVNHANKRCEACQENFAGDEMLKTACEHLYCQDCSHELFAASMTDESLFPPRCCRQLIPCEDFERILDTSLQSQFLVRKEETESRDRTYCAQPQCNKYVPKASIVGDIATCKHCNTRTCTHCEGTEHIGECPQDESYQLLVEIAKQQGWQQCFSCKRFIELDAGCNHITCPCGAEFCYVCGEKWKICGCDQWDEPNLLTRAEGIVDRMMPGAREDNARRQHAVADMVNNLRENHECVHGRWRSVRGARRCEECHHFLKEFIMECRQCHLQVCRRCQRHRL